MMLALVAGTGFSSPAAASAADVYEVRSISTAALGVPRPARIDYSSRRRALRVGQPARDGVLARRVTFDERPRGPLRRDADMGSRKRALDSRTQDVLALRGRGRVLVRRSGDGEVERRALPGRFRAVAYNRADGLTYVLGAKRVLAFDARGRRRLGASLRPLRLADPRAIVFAPTGDSTDPAGRRHAYIADRGAGRSSGRIVEVAVSAPSATAATRTSVPAPHIQTIRTSQYSPSSPDPSGIAYVAASDEFVISDSEVEELPLYQGRNLYTTPRGSATGSGTGRTRPASKFAFNEPAGLGYDPASQTLFVSDDDSDRVNMLVPGPDGRHGTSDDDLLRDRFYVGRDVPEQGLNGFGITDPEGIEFDPATGRLFICDGRNREVYELAPDGGSFASGARLVDRFDVGVSGMYDCEGIGLDQGRGTLLAVDPAVKRVYEYDKDGLLLRIISLATIPLPERTTAHLSSVTVAPSSDAGDDPATMSLWVPDRQVDESVDPNENDGLLHEFAIPAGAPSPLAPVRWSATQVTVAEAAKATLTINRTDGGLPASVRVRSTAGSAKEGEDFTPIDVIASFAKGARVATVDVPLVRDTVDEALETFTVTLSEATGDARVGSPSTMTVTIDDDLPQPTPTPTPTPGPVDRSAELRAAARRLVRKAQRRVNVKSGRLRLGALKAVGYERKVATCLRIDAPGPQRCHRAVRRVAAGKRAVMRLRLPSQTLRKLRRKGSASVHLTAVVRAGAQKGSASATLRLRRARG